MDALETKNPLLALCKRLDKRKCVVEEVALQYPLPKDNHLFIQGVSSDKRLYQWLLQDEKRHLYFVIEEIVSLYVDLPDDIVSHPRVYFLNAIDGNRSDVLKYAWRLVGKRCAFLGKNDWIKPLFQEVELTFSGYADYNLHHIEMVLSNLLQGACLKRASSYFGKYQNTPAIICGAGPSLSRAIPDLKEASKRALIFGCGSSLPLLEKAKVAMHYGVMLDSKAPFELFSQENYGTMPIFLKPSVQHDIFRAITGDRIVMGTGALFPFEQEVMKPLDMPPFQGGWNVATHGVMLALHLGCNPIICVGMDMAYPDGKVYAKGLPSFEDDKALNAQDTEGRAVQTRPDLLAASRWLNAFVKEHREITLINTAQGGLKIEGAEGARLSDVLDRLPERDINRITGESIDLPKEYVLEKMENLLLSFERCIHDIDRVLQGKCSEPYLMQTESAYHLVLRPNYTAWQGVLEQHMTREQEKLLFYREVSTKYIASLKRIMVR